MPTPQAAHYLVELLRAACKPPASGEAEQQREQSVQRGSGGGSGGSGGGGGGGAGNPKPRALLHFVDDVALFVGHGAHGDTKVRRPERRTGAA